ncbi:hypothetical protein AC579_10192 [Pseudocercospora musae]|uniref:Uncharacterized protein n=1 Tax=Pseudocercospora musae TaxID=113226 RepID=A0A139I2W6_9PEZI|nr:hypothetical protein AC579_10192 [Pseudocercospora musae]
MTCPALDTSLKDARQRFELHFITPSACTKAFLPLLVRGHNLVVVNNSSIAGEKTLPFQAVYGASKSANATFAETLRLEGEPLGIRVVTVITGIIETNLHKNGKEQELPEEGFYSPLNQWLRERTGGTNRPPGMPVDQDIFMVKAGPKNQNEVIANEHGRKMQSRDWEYHTRNEHRAIL